MVILITASIKPSLSAALDAYLEREPYVAAGVWETIDIEPVNAVLVRGETFESEG